MQCSQCSWCQHHTELDFYMYNQYTQKQINQIITNGHNIAYTEMTLRVKELPTLILQINKAMATCTCRFPWMTHAGSSLLYHWPLLCMLKCFSSVTNWRSCSQSATFEQEDSHCLYPGSHQKSGSKEVTQSCFSWAAISSSCWILCQLFIHRSR